jgi:transposase
VVAAVMSGTPREDVVWRYAVSLATIKRWMKQWRETGDLALKRSPGRPSVKMGPLLAALPARLAEHGDARLEDQCAWWYEQTRVAVSTATMSRAIARLDWTRKKVTEGERAEGGGANSVASSHHARPTGGSRLRG